jgi:hypothetical protein
MTRIERIGADFESEKIIRVHLANPVHPRSIIQFE